MRRIKDLPEDTRPREKLLKSGPDVLSDAELLAALIGSGTKGKSAIELAEEVLAKYQSMKNMADLPLNVIMSIKGIKQAKAVRLAVAFEMAKRIFGQSTLEEGEANINSKKSGEPSSQNNQLLLFDNTQFIYELALAQLELEAFGVKYEITNGLRSFRSLEMPEPETLRKRSAYLKKVGGNYTDYFYIVQKNRTRSVNQYLTHWIYPYKGKFHPQMIRALLNIIKLKEGDTLLDPFIGSGTSAVEAQLLGINCIGFDVSPLCIVQSRVKTESIEVISEIESYKEKMTKEIGTPLFNSRNLSLQNMIESIPNERVRNFYKLAELLAHSDKARRGKEFYNSFIKNVELMLASVKDYRYVAEKLGLNLGKVDIRPCDARQLPLLSNSIDGIITSPPYSIALDYIANDAHALRALGYDLAEIREKFIGVRGKGSDKIVLYNEDMKKSYQEMYRVLKPEKFCIIIIGNATYLGKEVETIQFTIDFCKKIGFKLVRNIDKIIFGLYNVMQRESILIFRKPQSHG